MTTNRNYLHNFITSLALISCATFSLGNRGCAEGVYAVAPHFVSDAGAPDAGEPDAGEPGCFEGGDCPVASSLIQVGGAVGIGTDLVLSKNVEGALIPQAIPVHNRASAAGIRIRDFGIVHPLELLHPGRFESPLSRTRAGVTLSEIPDGEFIKPCSVGALLLPFETCYIYAYVSNEAVANGLTAVVTAEILGLPETQFNYSTLMLTPAEGTAEHLAFLPVGRELLHTGVDSKGVEYAHVHLDDSSFADILYWADDHWAHSVRGFSYRLASEQDRLLYLDVVGADALIWTTDRLETLVYARWALRDLRSLRVFPLFSEERWERFLDSSLVPLAPGVPRADIRIENAVATHHDGFDIVVFATLTYRAGDRFISARFQFVRSESRWAQSGLPTLVP